MSDGQKQTKPRLTCKRARDLVELRRSIDSSLLGSLAEGSSQRRSIERGLDYLDRLSAWKLEVGSDG